jgi:hypothetical protein
MMTSREYEFEELLESAYRHTIEELGLDNIEPSFRAEFENLQKAHDAIHEYMLIAPTLFPSQADAETDWHRKSAFFTNHWEAFNHAHRSLIEALCAYYSVAFILLRATLELMIRGAFWECLSHKRLRENSHVLDDCKPGRKIKKWLDAVFERAPDAEEEFERVSATIYDKISPIIEDPEFRLPFKTFIRQLDQWDIFNPIPKAEEWIYEGIYGRLSADVHVIPDRTDIGQRLIAESSEIFHQELLPDVLREYANSLHEIMDLAIVIELNIMADYIKKYDEVKANFEERLDTLEQLGLAYSVKRAKQLLD